MEKQTMDFPTAAQLTEELKRIRYQKGFRKMLRSTISSLLVVAAVAVLISMLFLPVLRVTGTSMTPTLTNDERLSAESGATSKAVMWLLFILTIKSY